MTRIKENAAQSRSQDVSEEVSKNLRKSWGDKKTHDLSKEQLIKAIEFLRRHTDIFVKGTIKIKGSQPSSFSLK